MDSTPYIIRSAPVQFVVGHTPLGAAQTRVLLPHSHNGMDQTHELRRTALLIGGTYTERRPMVPATSSRWHHRPVAPHMLVSREQAHVLQHGRRDER